jgi:RimJ/RimL family protein N-acetyltransferase
MVSQEDKDIFLIYEMHTKPEIKKYISISDNYFNYVTNTENVFFYKVYKDLNLVGTVHLEKNDNILYMDILIFPEFQKSGLGTKVINDIKDDIFNLSFKKIKVSIDENNIPSLKLFENSGFKFVSQEDELKNYEYLKYNKEQVKKK